ncbi:MarR family transcriptional regulator [Streptosporangium sp. NPDC048047]|uniref:MarR family winged helix-turn-helix transcriptional regulator n=1 Tax=unclassified Streptosporangium TaxID=2632669 RepID=UPI00344187B4
MMDDTPADSGRPDHTARDLRIAVGRIARRIRQLYGVADSASDLTFTELAVLSRLHRLGPSTSAELADSEQVTPQAIGTTLGALARRGLIAREPDPRDGRKVVSRLTEAGTRAHDGRTQAVTERLERALGDALDDRERRLLAEALPLLERVADRL